MFASGATCAAISLESGAPIWVTVRKVGLMSYGGETETEIEGGNPFLSLSAADGSGTVAKLIDANMGL